MMLCSAVQLQWTRRRPCRAVCCCCASDSNKQLLWGGNRWRWCFGCNRSVFPCRIAVICHYGHFFHCNRL